MTGNVPRAVRFYRRLLRLYPRRFRQAYRVELEQAFRLHHQAHAGRGFWFWCETAIDVLKNAVLLRLRSGTLRRPGTRARPIRRTAMTTLWHDLRLAARTLRRQPVFTLVVVVTLGLGIGATTTVFTLVHGVLLAPLPYPDADRLVRVWEHDTNEGRLKGNLSPADFHDYRELATTFVDLAGFTTISANWTEGETPERVAAQLVTPNMFQTLGVAPLLGRTFRPGDEQEETLAVVLGFGFWRSRLAGDSGVVGTTIRFGTRSATVLGVMPPSFRAPNGQPVGVWAPWNLQDDDRRAVHFMQAVGRVRPDATVDAARAELLGIAHRLEREYPDVNSGHLTTVLPVTDAILGDVRTGLWLLMGAVGAVLIIACANLANLFLARGIARGPELALRTALGAGRVRLFVQLFTESGFLAVLGGIVGLSVAAGAIRAFVALDPGTVPRVDQVQIDPIVALFAAGMVMATTLVFGGAPALMTTRQDPARALRDGGRGTDRAGMGRRLRGTLVVIQLALAVVLLLGAGLLWRSFDRLLRVDPGFEPDRILAGRIELNGPRYDDDAEIVRFQDALRNRLEREPDIQAVGTVTFLPFSGSWSTAWLNIAGRAPWDGVPPEVNIINVSGDYFSAIGAPVLRGRTFDQRDHADAPRAAVINQAMALTYWEGDDALGAQIRLGPNPDATPWTVIGIVSDVRGHGLGEDPFPAAFLPSTQGAWSTFYVVIRVAADPAGAVEPFRRHAAEIDPELAAYAVQPMDDLVSASVARPRFSLLVMGMFAFTALAIAAVGVYGVVAYSVAIRMHEFGVRLALGASKARMLALVLRQATLLSIVAVVVGIGVGVAGSSVLRNMLFEIDPIDPVTFLTIPVVLIGVALFAAYQPARRAVRLDPVRALRAE